MNKAVLLMRPVDEFYNVPIYKYIQCGEPVLAEEVKFSGIVDLNQFLISKAFPSLVLYIPSGVFEDFEIFEGDFVVVHSGIEPNRNDLIFIFENGSQLLRTYTPKDAGKEFWVITSIIQPRWKSISSNKLKEFELDNSKTENFPSPGDKEHISNWFSLNYLIGYFDEMTLLEVKGESMIEKQIRNGDLVLINRNIGCNTGDVIAAYVEGGYTLKTYEGDGYIKKLAPANSNFKEITVWDREARSEGVVTARIRMLREL